MGRTLTPEQLKKHKEEALNCLDSYITSLIDDSDPKIQSKSDKLSYWLKDWTTFLSYESVFSPSSLRRYKRGEIVKAHLGYNVGSEEGGLHYCVVLDKENSKNSPVITVVPLTSVKDKTDLSHLHKGDIYLGNEIFTNLNSKISSTDKRLVSNLSRLTSQILTLPDSVSQDTIDSIQEEMHSCKKDIELLKRMKQEVQKMRIGSIALVSQIRTISKIRIYDPKSNYDILSNVKLSNEKLDLIDEELVKLYTGKK